MIRFIQLTEHYSACHDRNAALQHDTSSSMMLQYLHFSPELALLSSPCNSFIQLYAGWKVSQCSSGKNLIMENNLMLVNNVKQAALNCPGPAGFIIQSKFNYFLRKQLGRSLLSMLSNSIL